MSDLGDAIGRDMARGFLTAVAFVLLFGIIVGVVVTKACSSGWHVQSPITRGTK